MIRRHDDGPTLERGETREYTELVKRPAHALESELGTQLMYTTVSARLTLSRLVWPYTTAL